MKTKIYYLHVPVYFSRRGTIAGIIKNNHLHIGVALCSDKDAFSKSLGRTIAAGRADKKPNSVIEIDGRVYKDAQVGKFVNDQLHFFMNKELNFHKIFNLSL